MRLQWKMILNGHLGQRDECTGAILQLLVLSAVLGKHKHKQLISLLRQSTTCVPCLILNVIKFCYNCLGLPLFCWTGGVNELFHSWLHERIFELDLEGCISDSEQKIIILKTKKLSSGSPSPAWSITGANGQSCPLDWLEHLFFTLGRTPVNPCMFLYVVQFLWGLEGLEWQSLHSPLLTPPANSLKENISCKWGILFTYLANKIAGTTSWQKKQRKCILAFCRVLCRLCQHTACIFCSR